jgi:two-component system sensor histidine kinase CiaH
LTDTVRAVADCEETIACRLWGHNRAHRRQATNEQFMNSATNKKLRLITIVYWILLVYIVSALVWWFIALENQNREMARYRTEVLKKDDPEFTAKLNAIQRERNRDTTQYLAEGITFLALILVGALFVYRSVRRQIRMQQQQQNFMMAVTHELKTPIAIAKLNLETLEKHNLDESRRSKLIQMTLEEANRLNTLANNILVSSQLEDGRYSIVKEELDFSSLVKNCACDFRSRFPEQRWFIDVEPEIDITGDPLLLQILTNNLLENAVKFSPKNGLVTCRLKKEDHRVFLNVTDQGPGIPEEERNKIFEKFYRIGTEETRRSKGTGLGLYLCRKIAADHNASISINGNSPAGSNFTVSFAV